MFVLDTDHLSIIQSRRGLAYENIVHRMAEYDEDDFYVTIVSFAEQVRGWMSFVSQAKDENGVGVGLLKLEGLLQCHSTSNVLGYGEAAIDTFEELRRQKIRIGSMDLRIGAITLSSGMTLLTRNFKDFEKIPHLPIEDWTVSPH